MTLSEHRSLFNFRKFIVKKFGKVTILHNRLQLSKSGINACLSNCNDLPLGALHSREWRFLCEKRNLFCGSIILNARSECNDNTGRNLERIHIRNHPFMHLKNGSMGDIIYVKECFPFPRNVLMELEY
jgi:hypothetical protein